MLMRYFEKAVLGKPPATSGKQIFVGKSQVCVCVCLHVPDVDHPEKELFIAVFLPLLFLSFYDPYLERSGLPATQ